MELWNSSHWDFNIKNGNSQSLSYLLVGLMSLLTYFRQPWNHKQKMGAAHTQRTALPVMQTPVNQRVNSNSSRQVFLLRNFVSKLAIYIFPGMLAENRTCRVGEALEGDSPQRTLRGGLFHLEVVLLLSASLTPRWGTDYSQSDRDQIWACELFWIQTKALFTRGE